MARDPIWLLGPNGRPIKLEHQERWSYTEKLNPMMVFVPERHRADLTAFSQIEIIAPYHFKGRPVLAHLLGVAIGILAAGTLPIDLMTTSLMVLTFALSTLFYHTETSSQYKLARARQADGPPQFFILRDEDIPAMTRTDDLNLVHPTTPEPRLLTEREEKKIELMRYGIVAICGSLTTAFLLRMVNHTVTFKTSGIIALLALIVAGISACLALAAAFRILQKGRVLRGL